jgi:putative MATE family efflux protein
MRDKMDLTVGSPFKKIILFMLPVLIGNIFQQMYSLADTVIVGRTMGADALAAVGSTNSIHFIIFSFMSGLSSGVTILTSQYIGAGDMKSAKKSVAVVYIIGVIIAATCTILGMAFLKSLFVILNIPERLYEDAYIYQFICIAGFAGILLYNMVSSLLRAIGDSLTPLVFLIIASVVNIGLDFLLILKFGMGVGGAAWATVISQSLAGVTCMIYSIGKYEIFRLNLSDFKIDKGFFWDHVKTGLPISVQNSITGIGVMFFQSALNNIGPEAIAAYTACSKIDSFTVSPMFAIATALVTFTAQNYGAGKPDRIREGVKMSLIAEVAFSILSGVILIIACKPLVALFVGKGETEVLRLAQIYMTIESLFLWSAAVLFVFRAAVQGMGVTKIPMIGGVLELTMRIIAAVVISRIFGFVGLSTATPLAWVAAAAINVFYFIFKGGIINERVRKL